MAIDGSQCTLAWHVDDLKILHKKANTVTKVLFSANVADLRNSLAMNIFKNLKKNILILKIMIQ